MGRKDLRDTHTPTRFSYRRGPPLSFLFVRRVNGFTRIYYTSRRERRIYIYFYALVISDRSRPRLLKTKYVIIRETDDNTETVLITVHFAFKRRPVISTFLAKFLTARIRSARR